MENYEKELLDKLYDTYGFPFDLTRDILAEKGMTADEETFKKCMNEQREKARNARKAADGESWKSDGIAFDGVSATDFLGYTADTCDAAVVDLVCEGEHVGTAIEGTDVVIVLDKTVFYGEGGGQVGDTGVISNGNVTVEITDTKKTVDGIYTHFGKITNGSISVGDTVTAAFDKDRRDAIRRNHTAAHLLQAALRQVLGTHVEQAGQLVDENRVRFDFTHFSALTNEEMKKVEDLVNEEILRSEAVVVNEMSIDEAKQIGATALFSEKYGDTVRVVNMSGYSIELCGGTHLDNTAKVGPFRKRMDRENVPISKFIAIFGDISNYISI